MATAHKETQQIEREWFVLSLSRDEAETLRALAQHIGGNRKTTRRGDVGAIDEALSAAGAKVPRHYLKPGLDKLYFATRFGSGAIIEVGDLDGD